MQVVPDAHAVGPVQFKPPHCWYFCAAFSELPPEVGVEIGAVAFDDGAMDVANVLGSTNVEGRAIEEVLAATSVATGTIFALDEATTWLVAAIALLEATGVAVEAMVLLEGVVATGKLEPEPPH